jgi:hypothetical protein
MPGLNDERVGGLLLIHSSRVASPSACGRVALIVVSREQRKAMPQFLVLRSSKSSVSGMAPPTFAESPLILTGKTLKEDTNYFMLW